MIFNEIKCHVNTSLGLVGGCIPCIPHPVSAPAFIIMLCFFVRLVYFCFSLVYSGLFWGSSSLFLGNQGGNTGLVHHVGVVQWRTHSDWWKFL